MSVGPPQPFTAPAVRPATMRLWKNRTMMMMGTVTTTAAAAMAPVGTWKVDAPGNCDSAAGTVWAVLAGDSEQAETNAFLANVNPRGSAAQTRGASSGPTPLVQGSE